MIRKIPQIVFITFIIICSNAFAKVKTAERNTSQSEAETLYNNMKQVYISPYIGLRHDFLQWSFGIDGLSKLSELTWKNKIAEVGNIN